jgi:hypothetical protein
LIVISEIRINIEVEETLKIITAKVIPKILREIYIKAAEIFFKKKIIPKTFSSIILRDTGSTIDQGVSPRTT